jgi:hypothetical protein
MLSQKLESNPATLLMMTFASFLLVYLEESLFSLKKLLYSISAIRKHIFLGSYPLHLLPHYQNTITTPQREKEQMQ